MKTLKEFWTSLSPKEKEAFRVACRVSSKNVISQIAGNIFDSRGRYRTSPMLARRIEAASNREVHPWTLRPDVFDRPRGARLQPQPRKRKSSEIRA